MLFTKIECTASRRKCRITVEEHENDHRTTKTIKRLASKPKNALQNLKASITISTNLENLSLSSKNEDTMYEEFRDELDVYSTLND